MALVSDIDVRDLEQSDLLTEHLPVSPEDFNTFVTTGQDYEGHYFTTFANEDIVKGKYFYDTLTLNNFKLDNFTMAVASEAPPDMQGVLGLGFGGGNTTVLDAMVAADIIKSRTYSLWLNSHKSEKGAIIFGGYDNAKFYDQVILLDSQESATYWGFVVALTSMSIVPHTSNKREFRRQGDTDSPAHDVA